MGVAILALLVATLVAEGPVMGALGVPASEQKNRMVLGMRVIMVLGIAAVPIAHVVLTRLLTIVHTVGDGDPFVMENADRLQRIAWAVLGLELLHLAIGAVAAGASTNETPLDIDWNLSVTRWLAVLLLFVLAHVFEQGARMREDIEGTV
jgi:peptidoglycan biosynthesis protein MviN/MurJ (putative lipid II flippase)